MGKVHGLKGNSPQPLAHFMVGLENFVRTNLVDFHRYAFLQKLYLLTLLTWTFMTFCLLLSLLNSFAKNFAYFMTTICSVNRGNINIFPIQQLLVLELRSPDDWFLHIRMIVDACSTCFMVFCFSGQAPNKKSACL